VGYGSLQVWLTRVPSIRTCGYAGYITSSRFLRSSCCLLLGFGELLDKFLELGAVVL
jgi:hypothetical protein